MRVYRSLRSMRAAEIADRLRQHATARVDWMRYKLGADFSAEIASVSLGQPRFFFSPQDVPALCSRLRELFPETAEEINTLSP